MRHVILLLAMAAELFFIFYCLVRKANHVPAGYLCAVLSLVLLILTGWLLLFPKSEPVETTGEYQVLSKDFYYEDSARPETYSKDGGDRELPVTFRYPEGYSRKKKCPLVVFSHGSFGVRTSNISLYRELASHGYVVCAIDHTYQCLSTKLSDGRTIWLNGGFMKEIASDQPQKNPEKSVIHFKKWMEVRTGDINFVLDTILSKAAQESRDAEVYSLIDSSRIFAAGHSLGGSAALGVGRQRKDITAVISLEAPFLFDVQGVDENGRFIFNKEKYPVPVLNIYSDASWSHLREWKQYEQNAALLDQESREVRNVYMPGIGHFLLTDLSLTSPFFTMILDGKSPKQSPQETLKKLNEICLSFLEGV